MAALTANSDRIADMDGAMRPEDAWDALRQESAAAYCATPADAATALDTIDDGHWQGAGTGLGDAEDQQGAKQEDSWRDLYRILMGSLRASSAHFSALTLETLALGWAGLSRAHGGAWDEVQGTPWGLEKREEMGELLHALRWAGAFFQGPKTKDDLAAYLDIPVSDIAVFEPQGRPLWPAHYIAVDWRAPRICVVVRGTSTWADTLTDLVAHTEPYMGGHCHSGMLKGARNIAAKHAPTLEALLKSHVGYEIHCIGHSLGGGVSALIAHILRTDPSHRSRLAKALCRRVSATGFGSPPVFTRQLAQECAPYVTTLVNNHDLVPRTCVASLAELQRELEYHRDQFFANNKVAGFLRDSGALSAGKQAARTLFNAAMAGGAVRIATRSPIAQALVQVAANKLKQMHSDAMAAKAAAADPAAAEQQRLLGEREAAARAAAEGCNGERLQMEEQEARFMLYAPGTLLFLKRWQEAPGEPPMHSLVQAPPDGDRFGRIIVNRAMLRDHYLSSISAGIQQHLEALKAAAAAEAAAEAAEEADAAAAGAAAADAAARAQAGAAAAAAVAAAGAEADAREGALLAAAGAGGAPLEWAAADAGLAPLAAVAAAAAEPAAAAAAAPAVPSAAPAGPPAAAQPRVASLAALAAAAAGVGIAGGAGVAGAEGANSGPPQLPAATQAPAPAAASNGAGVASPAAAAAVAATAEAPAAPEAAAAAAAPPVPAAAAAAPPLCGRFDGWRRSVAAAAAAAAKSMNSPALAAAAAAVAGPQPAPGGGAAGGAGAGAGGRRDDDFGGQGAVA